MYFKLARRDKPIQSDPFFKIIPALSKFQTLPLQDICMGTVHFLAYRTMVNRLPHRRRLPQFNYISNINFVT